MKRWLFLVISLFLVGCQSLDKVEDYSSSEEAITVDQTEEMIEVKLVITVDGEIITDGEQFIEVTDGKVLLDVMNQYFELEQKGGLITSINGHNQDQLKGKYWVFDINGAMSELGAADLKLHDGDVIEWKLEAFEG